MCAEYLQCWLEYVAGEASVMSVIDLLANILRASIVEQFHLVEFHGCKSMIR